jgi:RNA polymerase sigma-70 factor (ECF subfamily)
MSRPEAPDRGLGRLMRGYVDGDRRAFTRLFDRLSPRLHAFLGRLVREDAAVDDLVQVTMLKAHLARERFAPTGDPDGAVTAWYLAIARNVALDHLRQRSRTERRTDTGAAERVDAIPDRDPTVEQVAERDDEEAEIVARVREAIAALPESQREVVELHKLRGMSMADVAARLQLREGAVRVRAHRAYKALARLLGGAA